MAMDPQVEALRADLAAWGARQPGLRRLWVFGSRARGTHRSDSDLDLAFEIDRLPDRTAIDYFHEQTIPAWRAELGHLSRLQVHLEPVVGDATDVAGYVESAGVLMYDREQLGGSAV